MLDSFKVSPFSPSFLMIRLPQTRRVKKSRLGSALAPNRPELPLLSDGDLLRFFGQEPLKRLISKLREKKPCKSDFQEFGNWPASSEMNKKMKSSDSFIWKKTHSGELHTCIKGLCKY